MRKLIALVMLLALSVLPSGAPRAGLDPAAPPAVATTDYELVVMEAEGCIYCGLFRRDVLPAFSASEQGRQISVRFLDVNDIEQSNLHLTGDITIVPTFVVTHKGQEVGRIPGYIGPEYFYQAIRSLMASAP